MTTTASVLFVGGTGKLGRLVADKLLARGTSIRAQLRPASDAAPLEHAAVQIARGDIFDRAARLTALSGIYRPSGVAS